MDSLMNKADGGGDANEGGDANTNNNEGGDANANEGGDANTNEGGDANTNEGGDANTNEGGDANTNEGGDKDFVIARPDNVPEKFWDTDTNEIRTDAILTSYADMEKKLTEAGKPPVAPESYEYSVPKELTDEFGLPADGIPKDDPYLSGFQTFAKEKGFSQEQHDELINFYIKMDLARSRDEMIAEFGKLGDEKTATARINSLHNFGTSKLTAEERQTMSSVMNTADNVALFEKLVKMATSQTQIADEDPNKIGGNLTQADVDAMMEDERYSNKMHPEYASWNAKVSEAYQSLYPDKKG